MEALQITTTTGTKTGLDKTAVEALQAGLRGLLLRPDNPGYDEARRVWNGMIDKRPALIACCAGVADVMSAVNFARTHQLLVSVRGLAALDSATMPRASVIGQRGSVAIPSHDWRTQWWVGSSQNAIERSPPGPASTFR